MVFLCLVLALAQQDEVATNQALAAFDSAFAKNKDSNARGEEIAKLAKFQHDRVVGRLGALLTNEDKAVRLSAAAGLATFTGAAPELKKSAAKAMLNSLTAGANSREVDVKVTILTAIGTLQEESSGTLLRSHFGDTEVKIAGAAVTAGGALKTKTMVEPLIDLLRGCERDAKSGERTPPPTPRKNFNPRNNGGATYDPEQQRRERAIALLPVIQAALQNLTGQSSTNGDEWEKWWIKNRGSFVVPK